MTTENADNACERTALPGVDAVPAAPYILIAEDDPAIRELLCLVLQLEGYRTTTCAGRQAALTWRDKAMKAMAPGDCPALLLLDLSVPRANDAAAFLYQLRARWYETCGVLPQIIVLTTYREVQEDLTPMERVVLKPFHVRDLVALIQRVMPFAVRSIPE